MATRLKRGGGSSSRSSEELRQLCSSERLRPRTRQQPRSDESGGAKDARTGARRGRRGENVVARRCDGAAAPPPRWRCHFEAHKPEKVVAVALANKTAHVVWGGAAKKETLARHTSGRLWATTTLRRSQIDFSQLHACGSREERASVMRG